ncbi:MAG: beta-lactamase family protein [Lewinellaceae bacterium]|nr:beta-lactamase family protein [Lewinellaceae bacterium]
MSPKFTLLKTFFAGLFWLAANALSAQSDFTDVSQLPAGKAGLRAKALIETLNAGTPAAVADFLDQHCSAGFRNQVSLEEHEQIFIGTNRQTGGLDFFSTRSYAEERPGTTMILKDRLFGNWQGITMYFDGPEELVAGLRIGPARPPLNYTMPMLSEAEMIREIAQKMPELVAKDVFSGTVLLAKGDKVLYEFACGEATKSWHVPNNIDTKFNLGSMNKMFTATAVMQLVDKGLVHLDDPISQYVDASWLPRSITDRGKVVHLLTHTSGLGSYFNDTYEKTRDLFRAVDDYKPLVQGDTLAFEPGSRFQYSNTGMLLLGVVIEKATGKNYFDYIRENIYEPAGMLHSDCYELDRVNENLADGYLRAQDGAWKSNVFMHVLKGGPAGGGYSTVRDLHRFALAMESGSLVSKAALDKMWSDYASAGYGFGFGVQPTPKGKVVGHGGGFPGLNSGLDMYLDQGYVVVVMSNYDMGAEPVEEYIRNLIVGRLE